MEEADLRAYNRALIRKLINGQKAAQKSAYDARQLSRDLQSVQQKIDRLSVDPSLKVSMSNSGTSLSPSRNLNNNNPCNDRWGGRAALCSERFSQERSPRNVRPLTYNLDSSGSLEEVKVVRSSPEESKAVRRKLVEEMGRSSVPLSPKSQQSSLRSSLASSLPRSPLNDATNFQQTRKPSAFTPPRQTAKTSATPKSILKHRKMIDSNVQVESRFAHTPGWMERAKHTRIRAKSPARQSSSKAGGVKKKVACRKRPTSSKSGDLKGLSPSAAGGTKVRYPDLVEPAADPAVLRSELGNRRTPSSLDSVGVQDETTTYGLAQGQMTPVPGTMPTPTSLSKVGPSPETPTGAVAKQRMMGYDWIAALLDQSESGDVADKHESYFRELKEFRRVHRDECQNVTVSMPGGQGERSLVDSANIDSAIPAATSPRHTCIHSYTVNDRLYTVPVNSDKTGNSRCAVCNKRKQLPSASSPGFVRVSIPRGTLASPYRVKPHRRKSFDPSDSLALSKHCLAGWVHQRPLKVPVARNVDLANETNRLKSKFIMTMAEAEDLAKKTKSAVAVTSRDIDQTTLYSREVKKVTNQLLDMSHAMQFQSQLLNKTPIH